MILTDEEKGMRDGAEGVGRGRLADREDPVLGQPPGREPVPAVTDLDRDPCALIRTGDWVRVDATHGLIEVKPAAGRS